MNSTSFEEVRAHLEALGFKKRAGDVFTRELSGDGLGWLGLNRATRHRPPGEVEVNPVVGFRHQVVERIVAELRGERFHAYLPPTVSSPLGYLMPEQRYRAWVLEANGPGEAVAADLAKAVESYALPFMADAMQLPRLCELLDEGVGFEHALIYRRPVAWLLAGDKDRAFGQVDQAEADLGDRDDPAAAEFRAFACAFRERFGINSPG